MGDWWLEGLNREEIQQARRFCRHVNGEVGYVLASVGVVKVARVVFTEKGVGK
jgi:hypothetical protein